MRREVFHMDNAACGGDPTTLHRSAPTFRSARAVTTIEIEVQGRWDALALSELLIPFHSFLVQHDQERWVVHARAPGCRGESLSDALAAIDDWRSEGGIFKPRRVASEDVPTTFTRRESRERSCALISPAT